MNTTRKAVSFYSTQSINEDDIKSVVDVLKSDFLTSGPKVYEFEESFQKICDNKFAVSVNSATSALHLAYMVNNISKDSKVWTSPLSFVATANTALMTGAEIDFVDIDSDTLNISPDKLEEKLKKSKNKLPDLLTVVHFGGSPCEMKRIHQLSDKYGFKIIEDASHALGAKYQNSPIGSNSFSDGSVFSFHPVKMITTGEGGMLLLDTNEKMELAKNLRSHGITKKKSADAHDKPSWYYEQHYLGNNYRLTEIQAALGLSQLKRLKEFVKIRNKLARLYIEKLGNFPLSFQKILNECQSSYHLFTIQITDNQFARDKLYKFLNDRNIGCQVHYIPIHLQPFFKKRGFSRGMFPNAEKYFDGCLSIPLHQRLNADDVGFVCDNLSEFFI